ncbi:hypothetical protein CJ030_MR6G010477 [Morella rubra]|uniref:Uncharacterized protein n=1 Tax=Morella rubra TaxID=262757 RepID=A0A6A1VA18_9ROSI|nr:hypothetical protein CJ030_MR6G010477 [Morella rubra]
MDIATSVFPELHERDVMTSTALIVGLNQQPFPLLGASKPVGCSHAGFVDEGISHFNSMSKIHGIQPSVEHYTCMVDKLGRTGRGGCRLPAKSTAILRLQKKQLKLKKLGTHG